MYFVDCVSKIEHILLVIYYSIYGMYVISLVCNYPENDDIFVSPLALL